jgi:hypothetical protein
MFGRRSVLREVEGDRASRMGIDMHIYSIMYLLTGTVHRAELLPYLVAA